MPMTSLAMVAFNGGARMQNRGFEVLRLAWTKIRKCKVVMGGGSRMRFERRVEQR